MKPVAANRVDSSTINEYLINLIILCGSLCQRIIVGATGGRPMRKVVTVRATAGRPYTGHIKISI